MYLPTTKEECRHLGWDRLDVILVTGDTYIDSPFSGVAVIGKVLIDAGYRTGIIAQPDTKGSHDIARLGEPGLFWGISGGCMDSMVSNYTATGKFRNKDDLTPGGINNRRPDRAAIVYSNLVRQYFKNTVPLVLGGIEASLRRIAHYDFWSDSIRNSVLFDAKADILIYGMGEKTVLFLADCLKQGRDYRGLEGLCFISRHPVPGYVMLPSKEQVKQDKDAYIKMFELFYKHASNAGLPGMVQQHGDRYLVHNPVPVILSEKELDHIYDLSYEYDAHPYYKKMGNIHSLETIRFSITTHRGCCGECRFCAISLHQGRVVSSRSTASIVREAARISRLKGFKGYITDAGGPTANMYGLKCTRREYTGMCRDKSCLIPVVCKHLVFPHREEIELLAKLSSIPGVKKVFIASGIRHDLVVADAEYGRTYLKQILTHHTSGQLKIAPEHSSLHICNLMGKPGGDVLIRFKRLFDEEQNRLPDRQFLTYYFIAAHPGCTMEDMKELRGYIETYLKINPEQVQVFTPVPSTWSTVMYYTGVDPFTGKPVFVERDKRKKEKQKEVVIKVHKGTCGRQNCKKGV